MESAKVIIITILGGALILAAGGLVATWGWSRWAQYNQKINLIKGIAREIKINQSYRNMQPQLFDPADDSALSQQGMLPRFRNAATKAALSSGILDPIKETGSTEVQLANLLVNYEWSIEVLNRSLDMVEAERIKTGGMTNALAIRRAVLGSSVYSNFLRSEADLNEFFERNLKGSFQTPPKGMLQSF